MTQAPHTLIIGMGPGLGLAIARRFGRGGHRIGMIARSPGRLGQYMHDLARENIESHYAAADVADPDALRDAIDKLVTPWGTPTVVVFNVGDRSSGRASSVSPAAVTRAIEVSALGALTVLQTLLPAMRDRRSGALLFTGSSSALDPGPHDVADSAAKAALRSIVLAAARDHERDGLHLAVLTLNGEPRRGTPIEPVRVAEEFWSLAQEPSGAWTRERVFSAQLV
jgi:NAD(P)-dependent dehydrogenase (short-subunit alcohol dehydrogenase family)